MLIRRSIVALATVALVAGAAAAPVATAAAAPHQPKDVRLALTGGVTMLKLDAGTGAALAANSIAVAPVSEAKVGSSGIEFPVQGGLVNPYTLAGTITHDGGLTFTAGGKSLTIRDFVVNVGGHRLTAWVDQVGARIPVLDLNLAKAKVSASSAKLGVSGVVATLDAVAAKALDGYFGTSLFTKGLTIGTVRVGATSRVLHTS